MNDFSGFVQADGGRVVCDRHDLLTLAPYRRAHWGLRRSFRKEDFANDLTVFDHVLVQTDHGLTRGSAKRAELARLLELVGLADRADSFGREASGFERLLEDIDNCLADVPRVIIFDEPAGGMSVEETGWLGTLV